MTAQYNDLCELALGYSKPVERQSQQFQAVSSLSAHRDFNMCSCFCSGYLSSNDADSGYWMRGFPYRAPAPCELISSIGKGVEASSEHVDCTLALGWRSAAPNSTRIDFRTSATDHSSTKGTCIEDSSRGSRSDVAAQLHYCMNYCPDAAPRRKNHLQCPYWHENGIRSVCATTYVWAPSNMMIDPHHQNTPLAPAGDGTRICAQCKTMKTPLWRNGPEGPKVILLLLLMIIISLCLCPLH